MIVLSLFDGMSCGQIAFDKLGIRKKYCEFGMKVGIPIIFHSLSLNILNQSYKYLFLFIQIKIIKITFYLPPY